MNLEQTEFNIAAVNEHHVACVLLLDTSGSMSNNGAINKLNEGVRKFKEQTLLDELAQKSIDIAIVEFNTDANVVQDFTPLANMEPPQLKAGGSTALGKGLDLAIELVEQRKLKYKEIGVPYYRPWIFIISDGEPTDDYTPAASRARELAEKNKFVCWAVGVPGYSKTALQKVTDRLFELTDINFPTIFEWLSNSLVKVSNSKGMSIDYPDLPDNSRIIPKDWD